MRHNTFSPQAAAVELDRTTDRVRRRGHWPAWLFLGLAAVDFAFFVVVGSHVRIVSAVLTPLPTVLAVVIFVVAARQPVVGRDARRINRPVALAALAAAVGGLILDQTVLPAHFTWWLVVLAAAMVSPYLVGAYRWLRR